MTDEQKPTIEDLRDSVAGLAAFRRDYEIANADYETAYGAWEMVNQQIIQRLRNSLRVRKDAKAARDQMAETVREKAIDHWRLGLEMPEGVGVVDGKELDYDDAEAVEWLVDHGHLRLLKIGDRKAYEKAIVAVGDLLPYIVSRVRIATDLSAYLTEEKGDE